MELTREFELPIGYEDGQGAIHKSVQMRKVKNSDIICLNKDIRMKALSGDDLNIESGNPVVSMRATGALLEMFSIIFGRVVIKLGQMENPPAKVFQDMYQEDFQTIIGIYNDLNKVPGVETTRPFLSEKG